MAISRHLAVLLAVSLLATWSTSHATTQNGTVRTVCSSGCHHTLIASCAAVAVAGDTCVVYPDYAGNEAVQTVNAGTSNDNRITFKAMGDVRIKAFRFSDDYVTLDGFTISGYIPMVDTPGSSWDAHVRIDAGADHAEILNNRIGPGVYHHDDNYVFNASAKTITTDGDFVAAGFVPGMRFYISSDVNLREENPNHDNTTTAWGVEPAVFEAKIIKTVTSSTITMCNGEVGSPCNGASNTVFDDASMESTLYANWSSDKNGVWTVGMFLSGSVGPTGAVIRGNTITDIAGRMIALYGTNHLAEHNTFVDTNGWRHFSVLGTGHIIRYNLMRDSPRWPGFTHPEGQVAAAGQGTWDMIDNIVVAEGTIDTENIRFTNNFITNVDHQIVRLEGTIGAIAGEDFVITNNVFHAVERPGTSNAPGTILRQNTFYGSAHSDNDGNASHVFNVAESSNHGDAGGPPESEVISNAWVENGYSDGPNIDDHGWYDTRNFNNVFTPGVSADYNFVAGPESEGFPEKTNFNITNNGITVETNGVNGGDPLFQNIDDPLGPDGLPWTADDGLMPKAASPLCGAGEDGADIGAYPCIAAESATVKRVCATGSPTCTYTTIQACADGASTGTTCLVDPGTYNERVTTAKAGITFEAHGHVQMKGFVVKHSNITIDGFDITGHNVAFDALISLLSGGSHPGAYFTTIVNNTLRDTCLVAGNCGTPRVGGIEAVKSGGGGDKSHDIIVRNNTFRNLNYIYMQVLGDNWTIEGNRMSVNNNYDFFHVQGSNVVIRRNVIGPSSQSDDTGNHPDFLQMFDATDGSASGNNILVEENFVYSLNTAEQQLTQLNNSVAGTNGRVDDFHHLTFRRNVFASITANANNSMPFITWEQNTFYRVALLADSVIAGGYMSRGSADHFTLRNNVILANGTTANTANATMGIYSPTAELLNVESVNRYVTNEWPSSCSGDPNCPDAEALLDDMEAKGYVDVSGYPTQAARDLVTVDDYLIDAGLIAYKQAAFDVIQDLIDLNDLFAETWSSHHNYVAGAPSSSYLAKRADTCNCSNTYTRFRFCEAAAQCGLGGLNGGDPKLQAGALLTRGALSIPVITNGTWDATSKTLTKTGSFSAYTPVAGDVVFLYNPSNFDNGHYLVVSKTNDVLTLGALVSGKGSGISANASNITAVGVTPDAYILGPDAIPFTTDDGLKPRVGSILCGADSNGKAIGAYSCDIHRVLETSVGKPTGVKVGG
jgi:hypothetical protein